MIIAKIYKVRDQSFAEPDVQAYRNSVDCSLPRQDQYHFKQSVLIFHQTTVNFMCFIGGRQVKIKKHFFIVWVHLDIWEFCKIDLTERSLSL